jgi:mono/diheme cytochrome c family protein
MKRLIPVAIGAWLVVGVAVIAGQQVPRPAAAPAAAPAAQAAAQRVRPASTAAAPAQAVRTPQDYKAMVDRYCVGCHNARSNTPAANPLRLDGVDLNDIAKDAVTWERVVRKLGVGAMPPQGMPHPEGDMLKEFSGFLIAELDKAAQPDKRPGNFVAHRLNRTEYANAVRDLVGVDFDATDMLPSDGGEFGFDNIATALKTSPLLLERYLTAALRVSAMAVGDTTVAPGAATFPISLEHSQQERVPGLPLGTRGGVLIRYNFPADAEYDLKGRLMWTVIEGLVGVEGWDEPNDFVITLDGEQIYTAPIGGPLDHEVNGEDITRTRPVIDGRMTHRQFVTAGVHEVGFTWVEKPHQNQSVWMPTRRDSQEVHLATGLPKLKFVSIEGPYNVQGISDTPSRDLVFACKPASAAQEAPCAERIFSRLARRAFRRPVTAADIAAPLAFYTNARESGGDFDAGIRAGLARILASPSFLYRVEHSPETLQAGAAHRISDVELASRLSFFLWSSIPDDQLLNLAAQGRLRQSLPAQVRRMIEDPKADAFMNNFVGQWLELRSLEAKVSPDLLLFPHFDDNVRKAFRRETELFFASVVRENRSVLDLLNANYTYVNERLAKHYGIPGVYGERFRRVEITDPNRQGLLGHGSLLSVTSVATRTSPVIRGKFILTALMGLPAPVPPPNVPALDESAPATQPRSVRERVEQHRRNPVCASCHRTIDPLGFSLENFDATGKWRDTTEDGKPVDTASVLQDGTKVNGPVDLRNWLTGPAREAFVGNVTERLMIYALGRGLEASDMAVVRSIVRKAGQDDFHFMSVILGIVESSPFQMRTKQGTTGETLQATTRLE